MTTFRHERKYVLPEIMKKNVWGIIKAHPLMFKEIYHERVINNIYFDTPQLDNYLENIDGVPIRHKVRIRWYDNNTSSCYLEIKSKKGAVNTKKVHKIGGLDAGSNMRKFLQEAVAAADLPKHIDAEIHKLVPSCVNRYKRRYFESRNKKFRITLDYDLRFRKMRSSRIPKQPWPRSKNMVVEVKYNTDGKVNLNEFTRSFPFRVGKFSKYTAGVEAV